MWKMKTINQQELGGRISNYKENKETVREKEDYEEHGS